MVIRGRNRVNEVEPQEKSIDINAQMQGTLSFKDPVNLKVNGNFKGTLEVRGTLTIGNAAFVEAHITGENIIIAGKVRGDIIAKKMLVLMPTAVLTGNISTPKLNVVEGAIFQGRCQMMEDILSVEELSKYLEIESPAIIELANAGQIPATRNGNDWTFERSKIDTWAASGKITD
ncbi:MAG TPA: polymer-forming cytoskeletal protein [Candidatus Omnitrophota bacterium]|nr:polymer-forming cytoskeletal protein [Candidatus Omnitrophota bacterium]HQO59112.1 polymer-forming cytoskeletal protein [Candidatus Omnitrophota bacterium]HQP12460.1 polymer-forming cytoskeletal protein [Candidatus Omnitrophota bacterium]